MARINQKRVSQVEGKGQLKVLKKGPAMRVIFFYPGEEGTYIDNANATLYENGIVHIKSPQEESTTHLQNCEVIWKFGLETDDRTSKVRLLKPRATAEPTAGSSGNEMDSAEAAPPVNQTSVTRPTDLS